MGRVRVSRETLDRWIRVWRTGGFEALKPEARHANPRTPAEVLELAERLRRENPERTGAHICEILRSVNGWSPDERTIQRHLARRGLNRKLLTAAAVTLVGSVGFVGLVVPHLVRLALGNDQRVLLPAAALAGGILLTVADTAARTVLAPQQLPVGVLTALIGVPVFLFLLARHPR